VSFSAITPEEAAAILPDSQPPPSDDPPLAAILGLLTKQYPKERIHRNTDIWGTGLADSQAFLDIIFNVEGTTGWHCEFDLLDFDGPMTPLKMARAFKAPNDSIKTT